MALGRDRAFSLDRPLLATVLFATEQVAGAGIAPVAQVRADGSRSMAEMSGLSGRPACAGAFFHDLLCKEFDLLRHENPPVMQNLFP